MKTIRLVMMLLLFMILTGCSNEHFEQINQHQSFIASVNILEPSIAFYNSEAQQIAIWSFEKAYTGATLVGDDAIVLYGHQLAEADLYELSSGKKMKSIHTGIGVTNGYYDKASGSLFMTNSKTNKLASYTKTGEYKTSIRLRNYPMSMVASGDKLYIVNYKDTVLSVVQTTSMQLLDEWQIPKSSNGLFIAQEQQELWLGGHGEGSAPNDTVDVYDLTTGKKQKDIAMPLMPIGFAHQNEEVAAVSHGTNMLYITQLTGEMIHQQEIAANPFAVAYFEGQLIVAGYDDDTLYFLQDKQVGHQVKTGEGPFQLLVREV